MVKKLYFIPFLYPLAISQKKIPTNFLYDRTVKKDKFLGWLIYTTNLRITPFSLFVKQNMNDLLAAI